MKLYKLIAILPLWLFSLSSGYSQTIVKPVNTNEQIFLVRTKQFNEFTDRFNFKTDFNGNPIDSAFRSKFPRERMLQTLFDLKDPRINPDDQHFSKKYVEDKADFINRVLSGNLTINKYSDKIIAEAKSLINYKGSSDKISVFLNQEVAGNNTVKWVITGVEGDIFDFLQSDTTMVRFIPPSSNETDFMNLKRALDDKDYLHYYATKDYEHCNLSVFFYMVNSGLLKFDYVEEVTYHITDLPGWYLKIKEFNRQDMNSGWLISDVSRDSSK